MKQQINLYTEDMRPRQELFTATRLAGVVLAALIFVVISAGYASWQASGSGADRQAAQVRLAEIRSDLADVVTQLEGRTVDPALAAELERLNLDLQNRVALITRLENLALRGAQGFSPLLTGLSRQAVDGVWLTSLEVDREPGNLVLRGLTEDGGLVPYYLEQLRLEPAFAGRRFRQFRLEQIEDRKGVLGFSVGSAIAIGEPEQ